MGKNNDTINYEYLVQSALRVVVKDVLKKIETEGLKGNHHFYISFSTKHPDADIPDYLRDLYPEEITIVLQHEFWDLVVQDDSFSVTLCFNNVNERLTIPFISIISFVDPSVKFGLQFTPIMEKKPALEGKKKKSNISLKNLKENKTDDKSNVVTLDSFRKK